MTAWRTMYERSLRWFDPDRRRAAARDFPHYAPLRGVTCLSTSYVCRYCTFPNTFLPNNTATFIMPVLRCVGSITRPPRPFDPLGSTDPPATRTSAAQPPILRLPHEMLRQVFQQLPPSDQLVCRRVCPVFRKLTSDPVVQRALFLVPEKAQIAWTCSRSLAIAISHHPADDKKSVDNALAEASRASLRSAALFNDDGQENGQADTDCRMAVRLNPLFWPNYCATELNEEDMTECRRSRYLNSGWIVCPRLPWPAYTRKETWYKMFLSQPPSRSVKVELH